MDSKRLQPKKVLLWITAFLLHFHSIFSFTFNKPSLSSVLPSERHIITTAHHLFSNPKKHHNGVTGGSDGGGGGVNARESTEARNAEADLQWKLFQRYHAIVESDTVQTDDDDTTTSAEAHWRGTWTTHDYIGDVVDEVVASVDYSIPQESVSSEEVMQTHTIITSEKVSDCKTCFDSKDTKTFPVALHRYGDFGMSNQDIDKNNVRCASCAMVSGPTVLRSTGAMCTELVLSHGSKHRLRVAFQHGPVWKAEEQKEEGEDGDPQRPPDGLRLFRTTVSRETLGWVGGDDAVSDGQYGDPAMRRGVPPFFWHNKWAGTSWTWGPTTGDRGWQIEELEDIDAWHGRPTGDISNVWSLRLPGGVLVQCPRLIRTGVVAADGYDGDFDFNNEVSLFRLAWLPPPSPLDNDNNENTTKEKPKLIRAEAGVTALVPDGDYNDGGYVRFLPPSLVSLRADVLEKEGELEGTSMIEALKAMDTGVTGREEIIGGDDNEEEKSVEESDAEGESQQENGQKSKNQGSNDISSSVTLNNDDGNNDDTIEEINSDNDDDDDETALRKSLRL